MTFHPSKSTLGQTVYILFYNIDISESDEETEVTKPCVSLNTSYAYICAKTS